MPKWVAARRPNVAIRRQVIIPIEQVTGYGSLFGGVSGKAF